jgi:LacI family transcriptional regulator
MKSNIQEIAALAGVAKSTVSKALNGQRGVSEDKRREILDLAARLNYEPSATAQALASSRTGSIGLLLAHEAGYSLSGAYWSAVITSIAQVANANNHSLLILTPRAEGAIAETVESVLRRRNVDGLIVGAESIGEPTVRRLEAEGLPFVFLGRHPESDRSSVDVDNFGGSARLVRHLAGAGYRRIACLAGPAENLYNQERVAGYLAVLDEAGLDWRTVAHTDYTSEDSRRVLGGLLAERPDLDALYVTAGGDFLLDCIDTLRLAGLNLSRFGFGAFDDYRFFDYLDIPICTVRQPLAALGAAAAELLFEALSGRPDGPDGPVHRVLPVELVLR